MFYGDNVGLVAAVWVDPASAVTVSHTHEPQYLNGKFVSGKTVVGNCSYDVEIARM